MKKTIRILSITAGSLLIGNFILLILISNINLGMVPVLGLGAVLLGYGLIYALFIRNCITSGILRLAKIEKAEFARRK